MTSLLLFLQRFAIFRIIWHILKYYWWVIALIVFWPFIDRILTRQFSWWLEGKDYAASVWNNFMNVPFIAAIKNFMMRVWADINSFFSSGEGAQILS